MKTQSTTGTIPPSETVRATRNSIQKDNLSFATVLQNISTQKYGSRGDEVRRLQTLLNKNGYQLSVDGIFGPKTREAVMEFQRRANLSTDGIAGPQTWKSLGVQGSSDYRQAFVQSLLPILQDNAVDGIDPKVVLAQAILETGWGRYIPGNTSNNLFGITGEGTSGSVRVRDGSGQVQQFRSYSTLAECVADYIRIIKTNPRYSHVLAANSSEQKARALQTAGYASDPQYADKLCSVISTLDQMGLA